MRVKSFISILLTVLLLSANLVFADSNALSEYEENGVRYAYKITDEGVKVERIRMLNPKESNLIIPAQIDGRDIVELDGSVDDMEKDSYLTTVVIPDTVKKIDGFFAQQWNLKDVTLPKNLEYLGNSTFIACKKLKSIELPETLKTIGDACFAQTGLQSISIPDGVETIRNEAFADCTALDNVEWDMTAKDIGERIFHNTPWLDKQEGEFFTVNNGETLVEYIGNSKIVVVPDTVKEIKGAFVNSEIEELTLPKGMKTVGGFMGQNSTLKSIIIPEGAETVQSYGFAGYAKLENVTLPDSIRYIGDRAFSKCASLKSLKLPKNLETIGEYAFFQAGTENAEITIPKSVKEIGRHAFADSGANIKFLGCPDKIGSSAFAGAGEISGINDDILTKFWSALHSSQTVKNYKTDNMDKAFVVIDGVLEGYIGRDTEITIPDNVRMIGGQAFDNSNVTKVTVPANVTSVQCEFPETLKSLVFEPSDKTVAVCHTVVWNCSKLEELVLPENMKLNYRGVSGGGEPTELLLPEGFKLDASQKPTAEPKTTPSPTTPRKLEVTGGEEIEISVDGKMVEFDAKPFIDENDRTQVPVRAVSEMLDCDVDWEQETQTVRITNGEKVITIVIGEDLMMMNNEKIQMDTKAIIKDERTFIPVRFIAEALGLTVEYQK